MPGKSRSKKGKYSRPTQKIRGQAIPAGIVAQPAASQTHEAVSSPGRPVTSVKVSTPPLKPAATQYRYVVAELRTIAILAGLMLVILFVVALVLT